MNNLTKGLLLASIIGIVFGPLALSRSVPGRIYTDEATVAGEMTTATLQSTSACTGGQQGECSMACSAAISNPYCMVVSASCEASSSGAQCTCTYFCAVARGGRQWTPKDLMVTDEGR